METATCTPTEPLQQLDNIMRSKQPRLQGTCDMPYQLAIIGGGPSGSSVIVRAIRLGKLDELCNGNVGESLAGVCIIDKDSSERFGGGILQDYIINSNTMINKFATNVIEDKSSYLPPEVATGTTLEKLKRNAVCKQVEDFGFKTGPLTLAGSFLREVGQCIVGAVASFPNTSKVMHKCTVEELRRFHRSDGFVGWKIVTLSESKIPTEIYAKDVLIATGGRQELPILPNSSYCAKLMRSDDVCMSSGVAEIRKRLKDMKAVGKTKVVIVGGSHSAFSAAWICLNKLQDEVANVSGASSSSSNSNATENSRSAVVASVAATTTTAAATAGPSTTSSTSPPLFGSSDIILLHRSEVRVFYATKKEADVDGYADIGQVNRFTGQIHPFGGLRGDAKALWRDIKMSRETRVRLVQLKSDMPIHQQSIATKMFDEAAVIIWACGYSTNICPIYESDGTPIKLQYYRGQVEVDDRARLMYDTATTTTAATTTTVTTGMSSSSSSGTTTTAPGNDAESGQGQEDRPATANTATFSNTTNNSGSATKSSVSAASAPPPRSPMKRSATSTTIAATTGAPSSSTSGTMAGSGATPAARPAPVGGLLGSGLGFGLKANFDNGDADGSSGRADGVAVYMKHGATLVLAHVLGNSVFGDSATSWEERVALIRRKNMETRKEAAAAAAAAATGGDDSIVSGRRSPTHPMLQSPKATMSPLPKNRGSSSKQLLTSSTAASANRSQTATSPAAVNKSFSRAQSATDIDVKRGSRGSLSLSMSSPPPKSTSTSTPSAFPVPSSLRTSVTTPTATTATTTRLQGGSTAAIGAAAIVAITTTTAAAANGSTATTTAAAAAAATTANGSTANSLKSDVAIIASGAGAMKISSRSLIHGDDDQNSSSTPSAEMKESSMSSSRSNKPVRRLSVSMSAVSLAGVSRNRDLEGDASSVTQNSAAAAAGNSSIAISTQQERALVDRLAAPRRNDSIDACNADHNHITPSSSNVYLDRNRMNASVERLSQHRTGSMMVAVTTREESTLPPSQQQHTVTATAAGSSNGGGIKRRSFIVKKAADAAVAATAVAAAAVVNGTIAGSNTSSPISTSAVATSSSSTKPPSGPASVTVPAAPARTPMTVTVTVADRMPSKDEVRSAGKSGSGAISVSVPGAVAASSSSSATSPTTATNNGTSTNKANATNTGGISSGMSNGVSVAHTEVPRTTRNESTEQARQQAVRLQPYAPRPGTLAARQSTSHIPPYILLAPLDNRPVVPAPSSSSSINNHHHSTMSIHQQYQQQQQQQQQRSSLTMTTGGTGRSIRSSSVAGSSSNFSSPAVLSKSLPRHRDDNNYNSGTTAAAFAGRGGGGTHLMSMTIAPPGGRGVGGMQQQGSSSRMAPPMLMGTHTRQSPRQAGVSPIIMDDLRLSARPSTAITMKSPRQTRIDSSLRRFDGSPRSKSLKFSAAGTGTGAPGVVGEGAAAAVPAPGSPRSARSKIEIFSPTAGPNNRGRSGGVTESQSYSSQISRPYRSNMVGITVTGSSATTRQQPPLRSIRGVFQHADSRALLSATAPDAALHTASRASLSIR